MLHTPMELELLADTYQADRAFRTQQRDWMTRSIPRRAGHPRLVRAVGLRLIALGERLADRREEPFVATFHPAGNLAR